MRQLLAPFKLLHAIAHLFWGYWLIRSRFHKISQSECEATVVRWSTDLVNILGLEIQVTGSPIKNGMLAANHASWLDILAMHASTYCRFVAKSEIKHWPVIGYLTEKSGNIFVQRAKRRDAHRVVSTIAQRLSAGDCVAVFPEGTTGDGHDLLPFHANMIESAVLAQSTIQPVAILFIDTQTNTRSFAPCYVGEESMLSSIWRTLCTPHLAVRVSYGAPQAFADKPSRADRREWANELRTAVGALMKV